FCFRYAVESNDGKGLRCSSIESGYVFSAGEVATIGVFNFHNAGWTHFNESLEAIRIGYLVNISHNVNGPLVLSGQTPTCNGPESQSEGNHQCYCILNSHSFLLFAYDVPVNHIATRPRQS